MQKPADRYEPRGRLDPEGFRSHVQFRTFDAGDLAAFVEHYWCLRWDQAVPYLSEELMHRPYVDLFVSADWSGVQATFRGKRTYVAEGSGRILGARFRPGAFHSFWNGRMADLQDQVLGLEAVFPGTSSRIEGWLDGGDEEAVVGLATLLTAAQPRPDDNIDLVNEIITTLERDEALDSVSALAREFDRSERWLQSLFQDYVGMGVKWLIQRQRLLRAALRIREGAVSSWADLAYASGYSSQQHFNNDFKSVVGRTPSEYRRRVLASTDGQGREEP